MKGHLCSVRSVAISSDQQYIVSGSDDMSMRIWGFQYRNQESVLEGYCSLVISVAVTSDNRFILSGSGIRLLGSGIFREKTLKQLYHTKI